MRKFILPLCFFFLAITASAQLSPSTNGISYTPVSGIDYVFIFNGLDNASVTYSGDWKNVKWYKSADPSSPIIGQPSIDVLQDATSYTFEDENGNKKTFWVIDYQKHLPVLSEISPVGDCNNMTLTINSDIPALSYQTQDNKLHYIPRVFNIKYNTLTWGGASWTTHNIDTTMTVTTATTQNVLTLPAPYCNTTYTVSGDQFASQFGITPASTTSSLYTAVAVICHETAVISTRDAKNENERPENQVYVSNSAELSAPLEMQFLSNPNDPVQYYKWEIFKDNKSIVTRGDKDIRYTFTEYGTYKVAVTVSNANACSYTDSIIVTVSESQIQAPNVFTPNGDGHNDEFRVAYKSITSFHCWIYNRWGRLVYEWSDPTKGWDGNIGGKKASPGAYFYVIKALGADYNPSSKPNPKTKRRVGEYYLKGDINLLRGAGN